MTKEKTNFFISFLEPLLLFKEFLTLRSLNFRDIFFTNKSNASDKWENHLELYNDVFQKFIGKSPNIIEIGVQNGGNL